MSFQTFPSTSPSQKLISKIFKEKISGDNQLPNRGAIIIYVYNDTEINKSTNRL